VRWIQKSEITVIIQEWDYHNAMEFTKAENPTNIAEHCFVGLEKRGLSEGGFHAIWPNNPDDADKPFRFYHPTILGVELFLWGQGFGESGLDIYKPELMTKISMPFSIEPLEIHPGRVSFR
jgi:hypothetical protein